MTDEKKQETAVTKITQENTDVVTASGIQMPFKELERWGEFVARSGLYNMTKDQAIVLGMEAQAHGIHPALMVKRIHIVQGRACMKSQAILAEFKRRGGVYKILESTDQICRIYGKAADGSEHTEEFGRKDAERIKHGQGTLMQKDNYKHYPKKMFFWRASKNLVDMLEPEAALGFLLADEAEEIAANNPYAPMQQAETGPVTDGQEVFEPQDDDITATPEQSKAVIAKFGGVKAAAAEAKKRFPDRHFKNFRELPADIADALLQDNEPETPATATPATTETKPEDGKLTDEQLANGEMNLED